MRIFYSHVSTRIPLFARTCGRGIVRFVLSRLTVAGVSGDTRGLEWPGQQARAAVGVRHVA